MLWTTLCFIKIKHLTVKIITQISLSYFYSLDLEANRSTQLKGVYLTEENRRHIQHIKTSPKGAWK